MKKQQLFTVIAQAFFVKILCLLFSFAVSAQQVEFDVKETQVKTILKELSKQTGYKFIYSDLITELNQKVNFRFEGNLTPISKVLDILFRDKDVFYTIKDKQIILQNSDMKGISYFQIRGKIFEGAKKIPLKGAIIEDSKSGYRTTSKADGSYEIKSSSGSILLFKSLGMKPQTIKVERQSVLEIILEADVQLLDDVVVTGYQTISKERATGAFNKVNEATLEKASSNIGERLMGAVPGINGTMDAEGNISFQIRGLTSLNSATAQPLIVVDGFIVEGGLAAINPHDVESITVLKDAAAASIWGARSANGVIVVTLKSGAKSKETTIEVNSFAKIGTKYDYRYNYPYASAPSVDYVVDLFNLPNSKNVEDNKLIENLQPGRLNSAYIALNENRLGRMTNEELEKALATLRQTDNLSQIQDLFLQRPLTQQHNLSIMNKGDRSRTAVSLMYEGSNHYLKYNGTNKVMANVKSSADLYKWLSIDVGGSFSRKNIDNNNSTTLLELYPFESILDSDGGFVSVPHDLYLPNITKYTAATTGFAYSDWNYNPLQEVQSRDYKTTTNNYRVQLGLNFRLLEGLTYDIKGQTEGYETSYRNYTKEDAYAVRYFVNTNSEWNSSTNKIINQNIPKGASLEEGTSQALSYNLRNQINFNKTFSEHSLSVLLGTEIQSRLVKGRVNPMLWGYNDKTLTVGNFPNGYNRFKNWMGNYSSVLNTPAFSEYTDRYFSLYSNAFYTYLKKYAVSGSVRTDASNLITSDPSLRYAPFWSIGAKWNISQENFMRKLSAIDQLAVRTTYGFNGNVDKGTSTIPLISISSYPYFYKDALYALVSNYGNPNLTWERTSTFNIGLDYSLFGGLLNGSVDFYSKTGTNLLANRSLASANGSPSQYINAAKMANKGIEFQIGSRLPISDKLYWNASVNFSYNHNKILDLYKTIYTHGELLGGKPNSLYVEDYNANTLWSLQYAGIQSDYPAIYDNNGTAVPLTGNLLSGDIRQYWKNSGTTVAPYLIGINTGFDFSNFSVSAIITGKMGHKFRGYQFNYPQQANYGTATIPNYLLEETKTSDGSNMLPYPTTRDAVYGSWAYYYPFLDYRVQTATHIRLQEINLSYSVPGTILNKLGIVKANVYIQGNNLLTWSPNRYKEDPEYPIGTIKPARTCTVGINLTF